METARLTPKLLTLEDRCLPSGVPATWSDGGATWNLRFTGDAGAGLLVGGAFWDGANVYFGTNSGLLVSANGGASFGLAGVGGLPSGQVMISFAGAKVGATTRFVAVTQNAADS